MVETQSTKNELGLEDRLLQVGEELRAALVPVIREIAGPAPRPSRLAQRLEIDKSLASRLSRAFRTEDPLEFMHVVPAPTGLRIFLSAAKLAKVNRHLVERAEKNIEKFQTLIDQAPGGRATLDASISASSPEARSRNERSSKQAVYKAMSYLLGYQCDSIATAFIIQPAADGRMVDSIDIHQRLRIRRLRPTAPVGLFSHRLHGKAGAAVADLRFETLDGELVDDADQFFLAEFSSDPLPHLDVFKNGDQTTIALSEDGPPPEAPFDLTFAALIRNVLYQYRTEDCAEGWRNYLLHCPCKLLVRDVFIRDDLYPGLAPEVTLYIPSPRGPETTRHPGQYGRMNTVDLATPIEYLGTGLRSIKVREMPRYQNLIQNAFDRTGWDPSRFRVYRTKIIYPVPMIYMNWWFPLPERPK